MLAGEEWAIVQRFSKNEVNIKEVKLREARQKKHLVLYTAFELLCQAVPETSTLQDFHEPMKSFSVSSLRIKKP